MKTEGVETVTLGDGRIYHREYVEMILSKVP